MPHRKKLDSGNWRYTAMSSEILNSVNLGLILFLMLLTDVRVGLKSVDVRESLAIYLKRFFKEVLHGISREA